MPEYRLLDTMPRFAAWWRRARSLPPAAQIESWAADYMAAWPELLAVQQRDYAEQGLDWRAVAAERIFPHLPDRLAAIAEAHAGLLAGLEPVWRATRAALGLDFEVQFVIYVGLGLGAGWATTYGGRPACLFGLENVAECGWTAPRALAGLAAHELGHLAHARWRAGAGLASGEGDPCWLLYEEGLAQRCEHWVMGAETWHEQSADPGWLAWCRANRARLAVELARCVAAGEPASRFFGSWYNIEGHSQAGYYLGHEMVRDWERGLDLRAIALLPWPDLRQRVLAWLAENSEEREHG